jgi:hypothetical protein
VYLIFLKFLFLCIIWQQIEHMTLELCCRPLAVLARHSSFGFRLPAPGGRWALGAGLAVALFIIFLIFINICSLLKFFRHTLPIIKYC